jgi:tetratricopeptide (TPR) repeat protein
VTGPARVAAAALALSAACAGARGAAPPGGSGDAIALGGGEPVVGGASDLAGQGAEELFAAGLDAYTHGDYARAADAFGRAADLFPASPRRPAALYDAGLALRQQGAWRLALERFRELAERYPGPDGDDGRFMVADAQWHLGQADEARRTLGALAARGDLAPAVRARALVERGVLDAEEGALDAAEAALSEGAAALEHGDGGGALLAKARYWLGEVARARFLSVKLDPGGEAARLDADLEAKSQLLLAAQGQYLAAMRAGDPAFGVPAGARIGELYEALYGELVAAPLPAGLAGDAAAAYRAEVRRRGRVLVTKAIEAYEETLAAARRASFAGEATARAEAGLERMRRALADVDAPERSATG